MLIGDAPPHQLDDKVLSEVGTLAKNHHVEIYALVCGDQEITEVTFKQVATSSGGQCFQIADATDLATLIVNQLKERLGGVPIEAEADRFALEEGVSLKESLARLGATGRAARQIQKLLVARGADVAPSGDARTGWVKVRPGDSRRFKIYTYISRWKFAKTLSSLLGLTEKVIVRKDLAEVAPKVVQSFLGLEAGDKATAGIDKTGDTVAKRAAGLPETTKGVERGEKGVVDFNHANRDKILALLDYWKNPEVWEHEYLWIPLELLP
ncbi:MAG: hypothetical protein HYV60_17070 [Planctomycetia bacterium]|nr:hypothetical protein [Planctomycetia bacterium]